MVAQVRRDHPMAAGGQGDAGGLPVARGTQQTMEHDQGGALPAQFADRQRQGRVHETMREAEKLMPAKDISSPFG